MSRTTSITGIVAIITACVLTGIAADSSTTCPAMDRHDQIPDIEHLPPQVRDDLLRRIGGASLAGTGGIAAPGQRFNKTDVIDSDRPMRRFMRAGRSENRWFVWYEHGGRGHHAHLVIYEFDPAVGHALLVGNFAMAPEHLCRETPAMLILVRPVPETTPGDIDW